MALDRMRWAGAAGLGAVLLVACVILNKQPVDFKGQGNGAPTVLEEDPFFAEQLALKSLDKSRAAKLLAKAKAAIKTRGPEISQLIKNAKAEDSTIASQLAREQATQSQINIAQKRIKGFEALRKDVPSGIEHPYAALSPKDSGADTLKLWKQLHAEAHQALENQKVTRSGLHITQGWPQKGGAMPTEFQNYDDNDNDQADWTNVPMVGVVDGGSGIDQYDGSRGRDDEDGDQDQDYGDEDYGYDDDNDAGYDEYDNGANQMSTNPFWWFLKGYWTSQKTQDARPVPMVRPRWDDPWGGNKPDTTAQWDDEDSDDKWDDEEDEWKDQGDEYPEEEDAPTPEAQRVKKLMKIKAKQDDLQDQKEDLIDDLYDDATNGRLSNQKGDGSAGAYVEGFLQGAVEASKKSVEAQGQFKDQLDAQNSLIGELEKIVASLTEMQRNASMEKTKVAVEAPEKEEETPVQKLKVDFYMEAECPGCKEFTKTVLTDVLNDFHEYITLRAIPYGNAQLVNGTIQCQHGETECMGNKIELCMFKQEPDWKKWWPAFKCIEKSDDSPENASKTCLPDNGIDLAKVMECAKGDEGELLHMKAADETINLKPKHKFTPWVVVDGKPVAEKVMDLGSELCKMLPDSATEGLKACHPQFKANAAQTLTAWRKLDSCYPSF